MLVQWTEEDESIDYALPFWPATVHSSRVDSIFGQSFDLPELDLNIFFRTNANRWSNSDSDAADDGHWIYWVSGSSLDQNIFTLLSEKSLRNEMSRNETIHSHSSLVSSATTHFGPPPTSSYLSSSMATSSSSLWPVSVWCDGSVLCLFARSLHNPSFYFWWLIPGPNRLFALYLMAMPGYVCYSQDGRMVGWTGTTCDDHAESERARPAASLQLTEFTVH